MYLLDTDILIWVLRGKKEIIEWLSIAKKSSSLHISVITVAEIYKNIFPAELNATEELLNEHVICDVDQKIARVAGLYWQQYAKKFKILSLTDCFIAGTANVYELTLVSFNIRHFPMQDIRTVHPLKTQKK